MRRIIVVFLLIYLTRLFAIDDLQPGQVGAKCRAYPVNSPCVTQNSRCIRGICECIPPYHRQKNFCTLASTSDTLNKHCESTSDCKGRGEFCSDHGKCICLATYVQLYGECKPVIYPGEYGCEDSRQCSLAYMGAFCDDSQICRCPNDAEAISLNCITEGFFTKLTNFFRRKPATSTTEATITYRHYKSPDEDLFGTVPPDGLCVSSRQCAGYPSAFCEQGTCQCVEDATNTRSTCVRRSSKNAPAASCQTGQVYVDEVGTCMTAQYPGQPCQYSQQCSGVEQGAYCSRLRCECAHGMQISGTSCVFANPNCKEPGYIWSEELGECKRIISPGSSGCSHSSQCSAAFTGAHCFHQKCNCPPSLHPSDGTCGQRCPSGKVFSSVTGQCLSGVLPGERCMYSSQCNAMQSGTLCKSGRCRCGDGLVFNGNGCAKTCPRGFAQNKYGLCRPECTRTQVEHDGDCYEKVDAGQRCELSIQCNSHSTCVNGICVCPANMVMKSGYCQPKEVQPMDSCADGEQCLGGSYCSNGKCICPPGTKINNGQCITPIIVSPKSFCNSSLQCGGGSICKDDICECPKPQVSINNQCQEPNSVQAGGLCPSGDETCLGGSSCIDGRCRCPFGTAAESGVCTVITTVTLGMSCSSSRLCTGTSICQKGICRCPEGTRVQNGKCQPAIKSEVGSTCANGETCIGGSVCSNSVCRCPQNTLNVKGICREVQVGRPGGKCGLAVRCVGGSKCIKGVCICPSNTLPFQGKCLPVSGFSSKCSESSQCGGGSYCHPVRHVCLCPVEQILKGQKCVAITSLSNSSIHRRFKSCHKNRDCNAGMKCVMDRCQCPAGKIYREGRCRTIMVRAGDSCNHGETCTGESNCVNGFCVCNTSYQLITNGRCVPKTNTNINVGPGESCLRMDVKCDDGSVCASGVCTCTQGTILHHGKCHAYVAVNPGESCGRGEHCEGGSLCSHNTWKCECPTEMIKIGKKCQPRLRSAPGFPCGNREICIGGSYCQDDICVCAPSQVRQGRQCVTRKRVPAGSRCISADICTGFSRCTDGFCRCDEGKIERRGECIIAPQVRPGERCETGDLCLGGTTCSSGICKCSVDYSLSNGHCIRSKFANSIRREDSSNLSLL